MTDNGYLFSLAGLSISLAGFSGLVVAFRRGGPLHAIDAYRLRQIPEIGLTSALLAIVTIPLVETIGVALAVRVMAAAAAGFTAAHAATLWARRRRMQDSPVMAN